MFDGSLNIGRELDMGLERQICACRNSCKRDLIYIFYIYIYNLTLDHFTFYFTLTSPDLQTLSIFFLFEINLWAKNCQNDKYNEMKPLIESTLFKCLFNSKKNCRRLFSIEVKCLPRLLTNVTSGAGTAYLSGAPEFTLCF